MCGSGHGVLDAVLSFSYSQYYYLCSRKCYDADGHIHVLDFIAKNLSLLPLSDGYAASNPPFYYILSAFILMLGQSIKLVQLLSFFAFTGGVVIIKKTIESVSDQKLLNLGVVAFFSFLPISLDYAYMVMNYSLGYQLAIYVFCYCIWIEYYHNFSKWFHSVALGLLLGLGMLTSLTNFATVAVCLFFVLFLSRAEWICRLKSLLVISLVLFAVSFPYFSKKNRDLNCVFCTLNRIESSQPFYQIYPTKFYYRFPLKVLEKPYASEYLTSGLWPILHQTFYSDYFNYLVGPSLSRNSVSSKPRMFTGLHWIDEPRIRQFQVLNCVGIVLSIFFMYAGLISLKKVFYRADEDINIDLFLLLICFTYFAQFMVYIHKYPNYVNIHAGYLYPAAAAFLILTVKSFKDKKWFSIGFSSLAFVYSVVSGITFWLR
jgi:hypothetical protein